MNFLDVFGKRMMIFDGAMGSMLQKAELPSDCPAELACLLAPEKVKAVHKAYIDAGCDVITANTFGANSVKLKTEEYTVQQAVEASVSCARECADASGREVFVAMDIGPTGRFMYPIGDLRFDTAYKAFGEAAAAGERAGAHLILIETMTDTYEMKAAVLAAKEYSSLPVIASFSLDKSGRLLTGADIKTAYALLKALGVDGVSLNCGFGPEFAIRFAKEIVDFTNMRVLLMPNAGLPEMKNGAASYSLDAHSFAEQMKAAAGCGLAAVGGCCGTTPAHMEALVKTFGKEPLSAVFEGAELFVTSGSECVEYVPGKTEIGALLDVSADEKLAETLRAGSLSYASDAIFDNQPANAQIYSVCAAADGVDEVDMLPRLVSEIQTYIHTPLFISALEPSALEAALKLYNGVPLAKCICKDAGKQTQADMLIKKFGAVKKV